jgi:hypothetical protein
VATPLTEEEGMLAVGLICGSAGRQLRTDADYTETIEVKALWPEALHPDALQVGVLVCFAIAGMFGLDATHLEAVAGGIFPDL